MNTYASSPRSRSVALLISRLRSKADAASSPALLVDLVNVAPLPSSSHLPSQFLANLPLLSYDAGVLACRFSWSVSLKIFFNGTIKRLAISFFPPFFLVRFLKFVPMGRSTLPSDSCKKEKATCRTAPAQA
jgi:hypothetical protein